MDTILVVEDEEALARVVVRELQGAGYRAVHAADGEAALAALDEAQPDLVILDWMLPGIDGLEVLSRVRRSCSVPVLMLTARGAEIDRVVGLEVGADDYVTKPFDLDELHARVRAALRRASMAAANQTVEMLSFDQGRLRIDLAAHKVSANGMDVSLTPIEQKLLLYLAINAGRVLTYNQILENVWGPGYEDSETNLKVYVRRLRKKIEPDPARPRYVLTQWGIGYYMDKV